MKAGCLFLFFFFCSFFSFAAKREKKPDILPADTIKVAELLKKGRNYEQSAPSIAFSFVSRAFVIAKKSGYVLGEARASAQLASINVVYNSLVQATAYAKQALALYKTLGNGYKLELAAAYLNLGIYQGKEKLYASALKNIHAGLSIYQGMNNKNGIFLCYKNLGFIYQLAGKPHVALDYYLKAKTLSKNASVDTSYLSLLEHLGNTYALLDSDERALQVFQEGIDKSRSESSHANHHLSLLRATGRLHEKLGHEDKAIGYHKLALSRSIASRKPEEQARSLMALADLFRNKNSAQSIIHLNKALGIARQLGNKALAAEIYQTLTEIYRQQNRFEEALMALNAHHGLLDTLIQINKSNQNEITRSNLSLQTFKIENERLLLENKKRTLERNAGGVVLIVIFLALIFIGYHFYLMQKLNRKLYISNRIKDKLFSVIGHDLRNPIGGISTMLSILEKKDLDPKILQHISGMKKKSDLALEILSSLLKWGQAQLQGIKVKTSSFEANKIIKKNLELLSHLFIEKEIVVVNNVSDGITVSADVDHFDFIIRNLLSNAIKFSYPAGHLVINVKDLDMRLLLFSVEDNGVGMSEKQLLDFKDGGLESSYGTNGEKGTGLGLMLVKEYVEVNGGEIRIESQQEQGSKFYFYLSRA